MAERPRHLLVIAGTGTEVGKTWVAARLAQAARATGLTVAARKPVQSSEPGTGPTDAEVLAAATGERPEDVCAPHRSYELAVAPFMAAARLGRPSFTLADLSAELRWPAGTDLGLLEPAGGVRSPMSADGADTVDLLEAVRPDGVALVADAGLGTINVVRLSLDALGAWPVTVVLNRYDDRDELHRDNRTWLERHLTAAVVTDPTALLPG
jgi:dethiobiotin synthetase